MKPLLNVTPEQYGFLRGYALATLPIGQFVEVEQLIKLTRQTENVTAAKLAAQALMPVIERLQADFDVKLEEAKRLR